MNFKKIGVFLLCTCSLLASCFPAVNSLAQDSNGANNKTSAIQPMFMGNLQHTGVYDTKSPGNNVKVKWKVKSGGRIYSSPVVSGGICYFGSEDKCLYAVDAATGKVKWKYETGGEVFSTPAISNSTAYFTSKDGYLYALETVEGKLVWKFKTNGEKAFDNWDLWLSSPAVDNGVVYFGSGDGNLYAVDAKSGKKLWQYETKGIIHSSPAIYKGLVYFGDYLGYCYAVDCKTHKLKWKFKTIGYSDMPNGEISSSPTVLNDTVYIGSKDHTIYSLDAFTGKMKWREQTYPGWVCSTPAVKDGIVCIGKTGNCCVYGVDVKTGRKKWFYNTKFYILSSAAIVGNTVYIGNFCGRLFALNLYTGKEKWKFETDACKRNYSEFFSEKNIYRKNFNRDFNGDEKKYIYENTTKLGSILSAPVAVDGVIYFGSCDGNLYALQ